MISLNIFDIEINAGKSPTFRIIYIINIDHAVRAIV